MSGKDRVKSSLVNPPSHRQCLGNGGVRAEVLGLDIAGEVGPFSLGPGHGTVDQVYAAEPLHQGPAPWPAPGGAMISRFPRRE